MQTKTFQPRPRDVYQEITGHITQALEEGEIVWKKPWNAYGMPKNIFSGSNYRGFNVFFLNFICLRRRYKAPYFITFPQAQELGGRIKKGEKGSIVIYWASVEDKSRHSVTKDEQTGEEKQGYGQKRYPKFHTVFNIDQTEGIPFPSVEKTSRTEVAKLEACEKVVAEMPHKPAIEHFGDRAFYSPTLDKVRMPLQSQFHSDQNYYCTLFHELAHSTGHPKRLNREDIHDIKNFGDESYSKEELTAELTASFLSGVTGIEQTIIKNSVSYIQHWLAKLKNDKYFFVRAATQAQRAADYILGCFKNGKAPQEQEDVAAC